MARLLLRQMTSPPSELMFMSPIIRQFEMKPVAVMKVGQKPLNGAEYVDAISGGTITSKGVQDMIENSLLPYNAFLNSIEK